MFRFINVIIHKLKLKLHWMSFLLCHLLISVFKNIL